MSQKARIQVGQDSNLSHPSVSTAPSSAIAQAPSDSISVGSTMVSILSTGVLSGVDSLGSKGSSGSGVVSSVSPILGGSKGNGAPGNKDGKGEGCNCGDDIPL
ncbi:hypothetical protein GYMLUDRAFT_239026 [Collybiopsis luxurians FD-317 M1]|nr:hypothetical protein GYMLUDRAFT_239026 [Collybiopsis luxurians FD-317 M1]